MSEREIFVSSELREPGLPAEAVRDVVERRAVPGMGCAFSIVDVLKDKPEDPDPLQSYVNEGPVDVTRDGHLVGSVDDLLDMLEPREYRAVESEHVDSLRGHVDACTPCQWREAGLEGRN